MDKIILFGNGQVALHHHAHFTQDSRYEVAGFTVDQAYLTEPTLLGLPVVPFETVESEFPPGAYGMHISLSYRKVNQLRAEKYAQAKAKGYRLVNHVSASAVMPPDLSIGENCVIGTRSVIDPYVEIGNNVHIASGCIVGHNSTIGDHCFLAAGVIISGGVTVEPYCFLGAGTVVRDRLRIGRACVIGAGSVILEDTMERGVYLGKAADRLPILSDQLTLA